MCLTVSFSLFVEFGWRQIQIRSFSLCITAMHAWHEKRDSWRWRTSVSDVYVVKAYCHLSSYSLDRTLSWSPLYSKCVVVMTFCMHACILTLFKLPRALLKRNSVYLSPGSKTETFQRNNGMGCQHDVFSTQLRLFKQTGQAINICNQLTVSLL